MIKTALFPGSFDPITLGHYDIVSRASLLFDKVVVAIGTNSTKPRFFGVEKCLDMIRTVFEDNPKIEVISYEILTVELCVNLNINYIVRGIRNVSDFEFERSLSEMNRAINPNIETIFLDSRPQYLPISSTIVREIYRNGGDVSAFIPEKALDFI